jgi:hypothetical protein
VTGGKKGEAARMLGIDRKTPTAATRRIDAAGRSRSRIPPVGSPAMQRLIAALAALALGCSGLPREGAPSRRRRSRRPTESSSATSSHDRRKRRGGARGGGEGRPRPRGWGREESASSTEAARPR